MKIRTGFVSNSSSASFVLDTKMGIKRLAEILMGSYNYSYFSKTGFIIQLDDDIKELKKRIAGYSDDTIKTKDEKAKKAIKELRLMWKKNDERMLKQVVTLRPKVLKSRPADFIKMVFAHDGIQLYRNEKEQVQLSGIIGMLNDDSDIPKLIRDTVFVLSSGGYETKLEVGGGYS